MDGPKRLAFTTLDPVTKKTEKEKKVEKTLRLEVDLLDSTDTTYPEFSYTDLVKSATGVDRTLSTNSEDPFNDDDDAEQLAAIAKRFEEKYNKPADSKKKKKKKWMDDHYMSELGDGYDESDTFIDNSEAYDEILPENVTTKFGGFYINSGRLVLKELSDDSEEDLQPETVKKPKKRRISSDEDSDGEEKKKVVKKKKLKDSLAVDGEIKKKKKKKIIPPGGEEKTFKKPKQVLDKEKKKENKSSTVAALIKSSSPNLNGEGQENGELSPSENGEYEDHQSVTDAIEAVAAGRDDSNSQDSEEPKKEMDPESIPKLPVTLPAGMETKIAELKKRAKDSRDGKCKFFTPEVNKLLLEVEMSSKQMTVGNRSAMFGHLAAFLPCSKDTLMKRAKTLRVKDLEDKIKEPMEKLKQAVNRLMPALQEKYEEECKKFAQEKLANEQKDQDKDDANKTDNQTESEEDETKTNHSENSKKRQTGPRKKFEWDSNTRTLLCEVVRVKMQTFQLSKGRSETAEEFCKGFLDRDVRPIWPKGWMQKVVLFKESRPAHANWTNPQKPKKLQLMNKTPGSAPSGNTTLKPGATSAPPGFSVSKISSTTTPKSSSVEQDKSSISNNLKSQSSIQGTPVLGIKKINPSQLSFDTNISGSTGNNSPSVNNLSVQKLTSNSASVISSMYPKGMKPNEAKQLNQKEGEKSWGHVVSDILRSVTSGTSPPKPGAGQQGPRQTSPAISSGPSSTFMSQFEKFTKAVSRPGSKDNSPNSLTVAQQQFIQKQVQQRIAQDKALQQIKELEKQSKLFQQNFKKLESSVKSGNQQPKSGGSQPKPPSQSPMSIAMGRNPAPKVNPKQLSNVFQKSPDAVSILAQNVIRQQSSGPKSGTVVAIATSSSPSVQTLSAKQSNRTDHMYGRSSTSQLQDQLRKSSPQVSPTIVVTSQAKPSQGHIKVTANQNMGQGQLLQNPSSKPVSTNGKLSPGLMQSIFGSTQAIGTAQVSSTTNVRSGAPVPHVRPLKTMSPTGSSQRAPAINHPNFSSGNASKQQVYPSSSPTTIPGYPHVKLSSLNSQQVAILKEVAKQQHQQQQKQQQQRSAESPVGSDRPPSGPHVPHLSPEQHLHALQYGFSHYKDTMK